MFCIRNPEGSDCRAAPNTPPPPQQKVCSWHFSQQNFKQKAIPLPRNLTSSPPEDSQLALAVNTPYSWVSGGGKAETLEPYRSSKPAKPHEFLSEP